MNAWLSSPTAEVVSVHFLSTLRSLFLAPLCSLTAAVFLHKHKVQNKHKTGSKSKLHFQVHPPAPFWTSLFFCLHLFLPLSHLVTGLSCFHADLKTLILVLVKYHQVLAKYSCIFYHLVLPSKSHVNNRVKDKKIAAERNFPLSQYFLTLSWASLGPRAEKSTTGPFQVF